MVFRKRTREEIDNDPAYKKVQEEMRPIYDSIMNPGQFAVPYDPNDGNLTWVENGDPTMPEEPTEEIMRALFTLNTATARSSAEVKQVYQMIRNLLKHGQEKDVD